MPLPMIITINALLNLIQLPFVERAYGASILVAVAAALLGIFVVFRGMSFFGDAISHSTLTGIAIALIIGVQPLIGAIIVSLIVALGISVVQERGLLSLDTIIGVFFSTALALGVILFRFIPGFRGELMGYLFGDILAVTPTDILLMLALAITTAALFWRYYKPLLLMTINRDIAQVRGVETRRLDTLFFLMLAMTTALSIKIVGVVLVTPLFILPAATAKNICRSFHGMLISSMVIAVVTVIIGITLSLVVNLPTGPLIVLVGAILFVLSFFLRRSSS